MGTELEMQVYGFAGIEQSADHLYDFTLAAKTFVAVVAGFEMKAKSRSDQQVLRVKLWAFLPQVGGGDGLFVKSVVWDVGGRRWHRRGSFSEGYPFAIPHLRRM